MKPRPGRSTSTSKRFLALARVSSREQEREGFSLDVQEDALKRYAEREGGTIVKLFRVSLLTVVVVIVAATFRKSRTQMTSEMPAEDAHQEIPARQSLVPWFLWLFIGMVVTNSAGVLPAALLNGINDVSRGCLVAAIAALGMKTSFGQLARAGWRPLALILIETLWIACFVLGVILVRH